VRLRWNGQKCFVLPDDIASPLCANWTMLISQTLTLWY